MRDCMQGWREGGLEYLDTIGGGNVGVLLLDFASMFLPPVLAHK